MSHNGSNAASGAASGSNGSNSSSSVKNLSCLQCRKRKTRCDKKYPCSPCVIRGEHTSCTRVQQTIASITTSQPTLDSPTREVPSAAQRPSLSSHDSHISTNGAAAALASLSSSSPAKFHTHDLPYANDRFIGPETERLYRLEARVEQLERLLSRDHPQHTLVDFGTSPTIPASTYDTPVSKQEQPVGQGIQDLFEDAAMGNKLKLSSLPLGAATSAGQAENRDTEAEVDEDQPLDQPAPDPSADIAFRFAHFLPPNVAVFLDFYFVHVDWTTRVLSPESHAQFLRLSDMRPEQIAAFPIASSLVSCYYVVIAIALHFSDSALLERVGISKKEASRLADALCTGSQELLWSSDFLRSQQLEHLACICLLSVYQNNRKEQADAQWALLGSAIKVAQNIGLARLDLIGTGGKQSLALMSEARRELGRRIWWNLVWLDWSHAIAHLGVYSIHPLQNRTNLPANVDIHRNSLSLHAPDVYTHSSYIIMRMRYATIYREITDAANERSPLSRAQIHRFVSRLNETHDSTPACLRFSPERTFDKPDQAMESVMIELMYLNRILRLHRSRQLSGFTDDEWRFARKACLSSASCIVRILTMQENVIHKFWLVTFYLLGAAMALVMELCCAQDNDLDAISVRASLSTAISLLSKAGPASEAARNSRRILKELLSAEDKIRQAFARLGGLERIAEENLSTCGTKDIFLDILQKMFVSPSSSKRKRFYGSADDTVQGGVSRRRIEAGPAQQTRESSVSSIEEVKPRTQELAGVSANGSIMLRDEARGWQAPPTTMAGSDVGRNPETLSSGVNTAASNESDWQAADQSLFPSLDGILTGTMSIDEWLGTAYPFEHL